MWICPPLTACEMQPSRCERGAFSGLAGRNPASIRRKSTRTGREYRLTQRNKKRTLAERWIECSVSGVIHKKSTGCQRLCGHAEKVKTMLEVTLFGLVALVAILTLADCAIRGRVAYRRLKTPPASFPGTMASISIHSLAARREAAEVVRLKPLARINRGASSRRAASEPAGLPLPVAA